MHCDRQVRNSYAWVRPWTQFSSDNSANFGRIWKKVISLSNSAILFYVRQGKRNEFLEPKIWVLDDDDDDDENYMKSI